MTASDPPRVGPATLVAPVTGAQPPNHTDQWDVHGTDLGHTFEHQGEVWMVCGDTFSTNRRNWRSNVMARVSLADGQLVVEDMVTDWRGRAKELLPSGKGKGGEVTVIPTNGVSTGNEMVLHAMSVEAWGSPGRWTVNRAFLATSSDAGRRWQEQEGGWPGDANFVQVAFVPRGDEVWALGIPAGRFGGAALARAPRGELVDLASWRYWDGAGWTPDHRGASLILPPPMGELSVRWIPRLGAWLTLYLDEERAAVVAKQAPELEGPWSPPTAVVTAQDQPTLYAPYLLPVDDGSGDAYFTLSRFDRYNVFLFRLALG
ncbi:MAG TPA: DUF4185 domain-containing protein [Acidimicrobiales bacterium]|nr:DUF4185 domain-containing protein [Acidimicrobiales bacterium]